MTVEDRLAALEKEVASLRELLDAALDCLDAQAAMLGPLAALALEDKEARS